LPGGTGAPQFHLAFFVAKRAIREIRRFVIRVTSRRRRRAYCCEHRNQEAAMLTKNWKLILIGAAVLTVTAVLTFDTFAHQHTVPGAALQMPEIVIVTVPATNANAVNPSILAGAEAIAYPSSMIQYGLAE
jgi:hypothetical protein